MIKSIYSITDEEMSTAKDKLNLKELDQIKFFS